MIDFDWYRSFVAVYRAGTVSKAAEGRFLTQPAVSNHVAALERAVGQPLFKRTPRRMVATEHGKALYARVAEAVDTLESLAQRLAGEATTEEPLVRLGAPADYFAAVALEKVAGAAVRVWVRFGEPPALLEALSRDEIDLAIATQHLPTQGIVFTKLADERFLLVAATATEAPDDGGVERWLAEQRWISFGPELPIVRRFWKHAFGRRPPIQPALVIPDLRAIARAVELGYGVSLLPDYLCHDAVASGRLRVLWPPSEPIVNELWLAYRWIDRDDPALRLVRTQLVPAATLAPDFPD